MALFKNMTIKELFLFSILKTYTQQIEEKDISKGDQWTYSDEQIKYFNQSVGNDLHPNDMVRSGHQALMFRDQQLIFTQSSLQKAD